MYESKWYCIEMGLVRFALLSLLSGIHASNQRDDALHILVIYTNDQYGHAKALASAIAKGADDARNTKTKCLPVENANYKRDVHEWADAVVLGSGVYNGNAAPEMLAFINSFDFMDDLSSKVGGSFATGGGVVAGLQPVLEQINRGLSTFNFVVAGGSSWQNGEGTGVLTNGSQPISADDIRLAEDEGLRIAELAQIVRKKNTRSPTRSPTTWSGTPPTWGSTWAGMISANLTQLGYDAGLVIVNFTSICNDNPKTQKMRTVYGDKYTVLTRCDLGLEFLIAPASRGGECSVRRIGIEVDERICGACGCPFCVRDTNGTFFHWGGSGGITEWTKDTSADLVVYRGTTKSSSTADPFGLEISIGYEVNESPVFVNVSHPMWVQTSAKINGFSHMIDESQLEVPSQCFQWHHQNH
eukprot:jgi/Bigna1/137783/aug1.41_g12491